MSYSNFSGDDVSFLVPFWKKLIEKSESVDLLKKAPPDSEAKQAAIL